MNRTKHVTGIVIGSLLIVVSPIVARLLYVSGMQRAFHTLGRTETDPGRLHDDINAVLYACAGGLVGMAIGLVILIVSIVHFVRAGRRLSGSKGNTEGS